MGQSCQLLIFSLYSQKYENIVRFKCVNREHFKCSYKSDTKSKLDSKCHPVPCDNTLFVARTVQREPTMVFTTD